MEGETRLKITQQMAALSLSFPESSSSSMLASHTCCRIFSMSSSTTQNMKCYTHSPFSEPAERFHTSDPATKKAADDVIISLCDRLKSKPLPKLPVRDYRGKNLEPVLPPAVFLSGTSRGKFNDVPLWWRGELSESARSLKEIQTPLRCSQVLTVFILPTTLRFPFDL